GDCHCESSAASVISGLAVGRRWKVLLLCDTWGACGSWPICGNAAVAISTGTMLATLCELYLDQTANENALAITTTAVVNTNARLNNGAGFVASARVQRCSKRGAWLQSASDSSENSA